MAVTGLWTGQWMVAADDPDRTPAKARDGVTEVVILHTKAEEHEVLLLLSHAGAPRDFALAVRFGALDVIVGGHSHTQLNPAPTINGVLVAQTGGHPHPVDAERRQHLGVIRLLVGADGVEDKSGVVLTFDGNEAVLDELRQGQLLDWSRAADRAEVEVVPSPVVCE